MSSLHNPSGISFDRANAHALSLKDSGKRLVFTNGCFDILHAGHVQYLTQARSHGDVLWVGLNSDASVQTIKGPSRPVQSEDARAFVLGALACVDFVTIFTQDTPIDLIKTIQPDIHVKGGDYTAETLPEYPVVTGYGGQVIIEPLLPGFSTTSILERRDS